MPTFQYEAMNKAGQAVKDKVEAASAEEAVAKIKMAGHFPTKVKQTRARRAVVNVDGAVTRRRSSSRRVSMGRIAEFTQQLSTLQDAGLPIVRSLKILEQQERRGSLKHVLAEVAAAVEDGS